MSFFFTYSTTGMQVRTHWGNLHQIILLSIPYTINREIFVVGNFLQSHKATKFNQQFFFLQRIIKMHCSTVMHKFSIDNHAISLEVLKGWSFFMGYE